LDFARNLIVIEIICEICYTNAQDNVIKGYNLKNTPAILSRLEGHINYSFKDHSLLREALTHRSALNEAGGREARDNERLEFLGDAVLGLMVASLLLERFPDKQEGELSRLRASLVGEENLARVARSLELGSFLVMGKGERQTGGAERKSLLADAFEALLAAVYQDGGVAAASGFVARLFLPLLDGVVSDVIGKDYKTALQELVQARFGVVPKYRIDGVTGPSHEQQFVVSVLLHDEQVGKGEGGSKKEAAQQAAKAALDRLN
jgi:ribonuclease-3